MRVKYDVEINANNFGKLHAGDVFGFANKILIKIGTHGALETASNDVWYLSDFEEITPLEATLVINQEGDVLDA